MKGLFQIVLATIIKYCIISCSAMIIKKQMVRKMLFESLLLEMCFEELSLYILLNWQFLLKEKV